MVSHYFFWNNFLSFSESIFRIAILKTLSCRPRQICCSSLRAVARWVMPWKQRVLRRYFAMKTFWSSDCPLIRYCCAENPKSRMGARLAQLLKSAASQPIKPKNYCKFVASPWWNDMKRKQEPSSCIFLLSTNSQNQRWSKKCLACFAVRETLGKGLRVVSVWVALPHNAACQKISFAKH